MATPDMTANATRDTTARGALLAVGALTVVAALLRFYGLGHQGFWFDEANTALLVHFSPGKMLGLIPQTESTPPLYYGVAWVWARIFGDNEAGLRSLSALAGVLVVPVAYATAAKLINRRAGVIVAALTACNPLLIWYSQEARSYELLVLFCALSLLAFAYARAEPLTEVADRVGGCCALALATHYYAVVAVAPEAAWLLFERRRSRPVLIAVGVVALCGLALIPLALSQNATGHDSWIANSPLGLRLAQIIPQFLIGTGAPGAPASEVRGDRGGARRACAPADPGARLRATRSAAGRGAGARRLRAQPCVRRRRQRRADHAQHHRPVAAGRDLRRRRARRHPSAGARCRVDGRAVCDRPDCGDRGRGRL